MHRLQLTFRWLQWCRNKHYVCWFIFCLIKRSGSFPNALSLVVVDCIECPYSTCVNWAKYCQNLIKMSVCENKLNSFFWFCPHQRWVTDQQTSTKSWTNRRVSCGSCGKSSRITSSCLKQRNIMAAAQCGDDVISHIILQSWLKRSIIHMGYFLHSH